MSLTAVRALVLFSLSLTISLFSYAVPGNDICSTGVVTLTPATSCTTIRGDLYQASASGSPTSTAGTTNDVWYKFTVPAGSTIVTISVTLDNGNTATNSNTYIEAFNASSCGNLSTSNSLGAATAGSSQTFSNLISGQTYFFRVFTTVATTASNASGKFGFSVCVTYVPPPTNDECNGAITLISNTICTTPLSTTMYAATSSTGLPASCETAGTHYDVWYKFTAASTTETITISSLGTGITNHDLQLYSGSCNALTSVQCTTGNTLTASGLTTSATYYVRFSSVNNVPTSSSTIYTFNICVTHPIPPPSNDNCSGATLLTVGAASTSGTVWGATASSGIAVGCATGTPDDDVWYKFTANGGSATISLTNPGADLNTSGARMQLFSGSCGALTSITCGTTSITSLAVTSGTTYYVRVYSNGAGAIGTSASGSIFSIAVAGPPTVTAPQTNEVFQQVTLSATEGVLNDPWEITYGADGYLWITEAKGYKVYRMDPNTGVKTTVLDISNKSTFLLPGDTTFNVKFTTAQNPWPQGGMAGLALHPDFMNATAPKKYVYVSYVYSYTGYVNNRSTDSLGAFFVNRIVRFTYNTTTEKLESPVSLCDTLPGSNDHNSQRMIIAPVNGVNYLFYAQGDLGAGQFVNKYRLNKAQNTSSYEGKILRFNLESDNDAGTLDKWIPNDNPFNGTQQSAIWSTGIRNNQGFAYAKINGVDIIYGSSHGPYSDDEINVIERARNYGHPLVVGYAADNNYNGSSVGAPPFYTTLPAGANFIPIINSETANAAAIGSSYKDPIFSIYAEQQSTLHSIYLGNPPNSGWPSVAPSGMEVYTSTAIPGWKNSLLIAALKGGRVMRLKLNTSGTAIVTADSANYFRSVNRFRDVALTPDGKTIFAIVDKSSTTSGPTTSTPMVSACAGCVLKYTFVGYADNTNRSTIPSTIPVTTGTANSCTPVGSVTINASNNNIWVPITGTDGNILAEIKANGNNLGVVTASFYTNTGTVREDASKNLYLDRNITLTPQVQPSSTVDVRLYITTAEFNALKNARNSAGIPSGIALSNLYVLKNNDPCGATVRSATTVFTPAYAEAFGTGGYVLETRIPKFSSFYFGSSGLTTLPLKLLTFKGAVQKNDVALQWQTTNERNTAHFEVERSVDVTNFQKLGLVEANGTGNTTPGYSYTDPGAALLPVDLVYYRLKSVDIDGKFTYSNVVAIRLQHSMDITLFPNPVNDKLTVRISNREAQEVQVQVSDVQGRVIYSSKQVLGQNSNNFTIDVRHWKPQLYIIKIVNRKNEVLALQKFEKV